MPPVRRGDLKTRHFFFPRKGVNRETECGKKEFQMRCGLKLTSCKTKIESFNKKFNKCSERNYCVEKSLSDVILSFMPYVTIIIIAIGAILLLRDNDSKVTKSTFLHISVENENK